MGILKDWVFINARLKYGFFIDKSREQTGELSKKSKKKYQRCPTCGGMVLMPCLLCNPGQFEEVSDFRTKDDYNAQH